MDVKSATRTVELLELFGREQRPMTLTEISRGLGAPLSSCYALTRSLETRGYLYNTGDHKHIYPTRKLFEIMKMIVDTEPWVADLEADVLALRDKTQETVVLGRIHGDRMILLIVAESQQRVRFTASAGDREVLHATSLGKALLSALPKNEREKLLDKMAFEQITGKTIIDRAAFTEQLEEGARRGYSITQGEYIAEASSIAAAIQLSGDLCAIGVVGPTHRLMANFDQHLRDLARFVQKIQGGLNPPIAKWLN